MTNRSALRFTSHVGHKPWFFVPDTGTPGGSAVLVAPDGSEVEAIETQTTTGEHSSFGPRVGFRVPYNFDVEGDYVFRITQDDEVTEYEIEVQARRRILYKDGKTLIFVGGELGTPERDQ